MLEILTDEQLTLLPAYQTRWQQDALSPEPLDRARVTEILNTAYRLSNHPAPSLFFFDSPYQAIAHLGLPTTRTPIIL